ncbi:hypothetical protein FOZ62_013453, partial [Perkinsus olseni]
MSSKQQLHLGVSTIVAAIVASLLPLGDAIGAAAKGDGYPSLSSHHHYKPIYGDRTVKCEFGNEQLDDGRQVTRLEILLGETDMSTGKMHCPAAGGRTGFDMGYLWGSIMWFNLDAPGGGYGPSYEFKGDGPVNDPFASVRWSAGGAIRSLKSSASASNEETEKICMAGITALKKKFLTYKDLCTKNYAIGKEVLRA